MISPRGYDNITEKAHQLTDEARHYDWSLSEVIKIIRMEWVNTHRDALTYAKWERLIMQKQTDQNQNPATWPKKYGSINHPWPKYACPRCEKALSDDDLVVLIAEAGMMKIIHEACPPPSRAESGGLTREPRNTEGIPACEIIEPLRPDQIRPLSAEWEGSGYNPEQCERLVKLFYENGKTIASLRAELETVKLNLNNVIAREQSNNDALCRKLEAVRPLIGEMRHEIVGSDYHTADSCLHCKVLAILDADPAG